jgi:hypothetical protein
VENDASSFHNSLGKSAEPWIGLSDKGLIRPQSLSGNRMDRGCFAIEFRLPLSKEKILLDYQGQAGFPNSFALFFDPEIGVALVHRSRGKVARHMIDGPLDAASGMARITFGFDAQAQTWDMTYCVLGVENSEKSAYGNHVLPIGFADLDQICATQRRSDCVLWFGFSRGRTLPVTKPWIGPRTMVETSLGMVAAGNLRAGDVIITPENGPLTLRSVQRIELPARGTFAPVLLRAPFFGTGQDVLVSGAQKLLISTGEVEYLFGTDAVLVHAQEVIDGRTALGDERRMVTSAICLDLGQSAPIDLGGLQLMIAGPQEEEFPTLTRFEAATLMAMLRRQVSRVA